MSEGRGRVCVEGLMYVTDSFAVAYSKAVESGDRRTRLLMGSLDRPRMREEGREMEKHRVI